jgi:nicotinamide riboside kinase
MAKIGFCGTMSVGKSTLVKALACLPEFKDYHVSVERSEYLKSLGVKLNTDSTKIGQFLFMGERSSELYQENLITDRTVYDVSAFTMSAKSIEDHEKNIMIKAFMLLRNEYDYIFYVSPEGVQIENNGVRCTDPIYREKIDSTIKSLLEKYPPKKLIVVKGTTEERIHQIKQTLF